MHGFIVAALVTAAHDATVSAYSFAHNIWFWHKKTTHSFVGGFFITLLTWFIGLNLNYKLIIFPVIKDSSPPMAG